MKAMNNNNYNIKRIFHQTAFENNLQKIIQKFGDKTGIVVKSNAYGIGINRVIPILVKHNIKHLFCQDIIEAIEIRNLVPDTNFNIYTFTGVMQGQEKDFLNYNIIPICVSLDQIKSYNDFAKSQNKKLKTAIHFDTGMNRTGLSLFDIETLSQNYKNITNNLDVVLHISHIFDSSSLNKAAKKQLTNFNKMTAMLPVAKKSLSATGGSFNLPSEFHFDIVRIGYGIYGMRKDMEKVISVYAKILQIRDVNAGEKIGYFGSFKANKPMKIAIINIGYKDGYSRGLSHTNKWQDKIRNFFKSGANFTRSYMTIGKYKCPVVGIISMNNTMIDVSSVPNEILNKTNWVEVIGKDANILDFRIANGFIPAELLTSLLQQNNNAIDITE